MVRIANYYDIIRYPIVTEKSTAAYNLRKVIFKVAKKSNKVSVKSAVEGIFGVEVSKVNIINVPGVNKIFRGRQGYMSGFKKAIVTLKNDDMLKRIVGE